GATAAVPSSAGAKGHVFFRVVVYNAVEETVSTLHVVDLAGGWEPPLDKPAGRRGSKGSGTGPARPSAASREWNSFDAMLTGLTPPAPPTRGSADDASAVASSAEVSCTCSFHEEKGAVAALEERAAGGGLPKTSTPSRPLPRPHPLFGAPKGKSFGGGGGGKLVEALQPLISGNTRTWLVVSAGGEGQGGPGAAWRALDVARRATGISTMCIRLRGVALADLRLRSAEKVLVGDTDSSGGSIAKHGNVVASGADAGPGVSDGRDSRGRPPASDTPAKPAPDSSSARQSLSETKEREGCLASPTPALSDRSQAISGNLGKARVGESLSSPGLSLSSLANGESLLSLASTAFGEGARGRGSVGTGGRGKEEVNSYLDDFLAGFVRGGNDEEYSGNDRPRRISSDGLLGPDVTLSDGQEEVAVA
ncbi:unnamed protein product, partial [Hapterophycus canaliculatus]